MSATNRGGKRTTNDNYPTPEWATHRFLERESLRGIPLCGRILEPCAGDGAIIRAFQSAPGIAGAVDWTAVEIRPECRRLLNQLGAETSIGDFVARAAWLARRGRRFDLVISNPPYLLAEAVIRAALELAPWVVMLLRINFLGSEQRADWLSQNMPDHYSLPNRPPFAKNKHGKPGTDATEYAWFVWGPHSRGGSVGRHEILGVTPREVRARHVAALRLAA